MSNVEWTHRERTTCIGCESDALVSILDMGNLCVSAFPSPGEEDPINPPLHLVMCDQCSLLQLKDVTNPELLYRTYWYRSGTNATMKAALKDITDAAQRVVGQLSADDAVVDIGSNDGTLLSSYDVDGLRRIGFEPSNIALEAQAANPDLEIINDFFGFRDGLQNVASVVTSIAMFYDLEHPHLFARDVSKILKDDGVWIMQIAYLPAMLERNAFDGICHEHLCYYSLESLEPILQREGLVVVDAEIIDINEGSIRLYIKKNGEPSERLIDLREQEDAWKLRDLATYEKFGDDIRGIRDKTIAFFEQAAAEGKVVHGYGASTKGNTLLQYFGITKEMIPAIWERQEVKWGLETCGTRIPIIGEQDGRDQKPDYLFVLPWHFADEFVQREADYRANGGAMVLPLPEFKVVE